MSLRTTWIHNHSWHWLVTNMRGEKHGINKIQRHTTSYFISWLVYLSLAMTPCTLLFLLAIRGDAFWIVNSENDKMHFRKLLIQAVYDQGKEQIEPALAHLLFFLNNTCHLIVLSLSYLHRYSWLSHSSPAETDWFFVCF